MFWSFFDEKNVFSYYCESWFFQHRTPGSEKKRRDRKFYFRPSWMNIVLLDQKMRCCKLGFLEAIMEQNIFFYIGLVSDQKLVIFCVSVEALQNEKFTEA
jgi:hypothetical protein